MRGSLCVCHLVSPWTILILLSSTHWYVSCVVLRSAAQYHSLLFDIAFLVLSCLFCKPSVKSSCHCPQFLSYFRWDAHSAILLIAPNCSRDGLVLLLLIWASTVYFHELPQHRLCQPVQLVWKVMANPISCEQLPVAATYNLCSTAAVENQVRHQIMIFKYDAILWICCCNQPPPVLDLNASTPRSDEWSTHGPGLQSIHKMYQTLHSISVCRDLHGLPCWNMRGPHANSALRAATAARNIIWSSYKLQQTWSPSHQP